MEKLQPKLFVLTLILCASFTLYCGGTRQLQSITLSPASADARNYSNGQVQFTATGHYNMSPGAVTPQSAEWGTCYQNVPTQAVSVTSAGLAQCGSGAVGNYTVFASDLVSSGSSCTVVTACGGGCSIVQGTAQLTCP
jgi:hypothetical protein